MEAASSSPPPDEVLRVGSSRQKRTFELMEDRASAASDDEREGEQSADEDDGYSAARKNGSGRRRESRQDDEDSEMTDLDDPRDPPSRRLSTLSTASKGKAKAEDSDEEADASIPAGSDTVECLWESCGKHFSTLQSLIQHLHSRHIGFHKARYTCEWVGCPRKGKTQTSRFALLSHLRSHTGEKPFTCPLPECDKSFTRSDALSKHMRLQHGLVQSAARRGKQLRKPRVSNSKGGDEEGEEEEGIALSDFESVEKPPVRPDTTFTDAELGIVRAPYEDDEEEAFILTMREKGAEVLKQYWDLGTGTLAPVESASDTEEEEAEDKAEHSHNTRRNAKRFKPSALDLINNNAASAASRAQPKKEMAEAAPENRYKKLYLIEQAKLKFLRAENEELRREFEELQREEAKVRAQKTDILEQVLTLELGQDVDAIFSPKGTPPPMPTYTEQRGPPPAV